MIISASVISLCFSLFLISPVLATIPKTPSNTVNMMVGHYFEDYYEYITFVKEGQNGHLILSNLFTNDDPSRYIAVWWPYSLMGFITYLLKIDIPVQFIFWFSSMVFSFVFFMLVFVTISRLLVIEKPLTKLFAFLFVLFSGDFFTISFSPAFTIKPIDYWYAIGTPFARFGMAVPHHQLTQIVFLAGLLFVLGKNKSINILKETAILFIFSLLLLSLSPPHLILFLLACFVARLIYIIINLQRWGISRSSMKFSKIAYGSKNEFMEREMSETISEDSTNNTDTKPSCFASKKILYASEIIKQHEPQIISLLLTILLLSPFAFLLNQHVSSSPSLLAGKIWDINHYSYPSLIRFAQNTGPLLILAVLGLPFYFSRFSLPKLLFFTVTLFSFLFALAPQFAPILRLIGIHNLRFNTSLSYIFLSVSSILFIDRLGKKPFIKFAVFFSLLSFFLVSLYANWRISLSVPYGAGSHQFVPAPLYQGIKLLEKEKDDRVVLTTPSSLYGLLVTSIAGKRVFLGRSIFTLDMSKIAAVADAFYTLKMTPTEAKDFLEREKIGYILFAPWEVDAQKLLTKYDFLKMSFQNNHLTVLTY